MDIRLMTESDDEEVSKLYVKSWKAGYDGMLPPDFLANLSPERWRGRFVGGAGSFVLTEGGVIVGHSAARRSEDETKRGWGEIHTLYILPEYWGHGYGGALFDHSVAWLKRQGYDNIFLWVLNTNMRARRFYEKHGFMETSDLILCEVGGERVTDIRYVKS